MSEETPQDLVIAQIEITAYLNPEGRMVVSSNFGEDGAADLPAYGT